MRYTIEETEHGWVLHCGDETLASTDPAKPWTRADAVLAMIQRAAADDAMVNEIADEELGVGELAPMPMPMPEGDGEGGDMPMTQDEALLPEVWVSGPNGACMKAMTGPGRDFTNCTFSWRKTPLPLLVQTENAMGHMEAEWCGVVQSVAMRQDGGLDMTGRFFANDAGEAARLIMMGAGRAGCSVDPSENVSVTWKCNETDEDGWCIDEVAVFDAYEVAGLTIVAFPGFEDCYLALEGSDALTASASEFVPVPDRPPRDWFFMPEPEAGSPLLVRQPDKGGDGHGPRWGVPLTVTDSGQVYGHVAAAGTCHIAYQGQCITPPAPSPSGYARFHLGNVVTDTGEAVPTGTLVVGLDHALHDMRAADARDHYAHTGCAWGDVRAIDGVFGIWVCGSLRPDVTPAQLRVIRASGGLSGDWRVFGDDHDMVAAELVNVTGFPISREAVAASGWDPAMPHLTRRIENGRVVALTAAGVVYPAPATIEAVVASGMVEECDDCAARARVRTRRAGQATAKLSPEDRELLSALLARLDRMEPTLAAVELRTRHLRRTAADEVAARLASVS